LTAFAGKLVKRTPRTSDDAPVETERERAFWLRYVRASHVLNLFIVAIDTAYTLATFSSGSHRVALLIVNLAALGGVAASLALVPEERIAASRHRDLIFGSWLVAGSAIVTVAIALDGGLHSPLVWLFPLSVMLTATAHRPRLVVCSSVASLAGYLLLAATTSGSGGESTASIAVRAAYLVALAYSGATTAHFRYRDHDSLVGLTQQLGTLADHDGLTGLLNHRAFHEHLDREFSRAERCGDPLALLMIDVDHFKSINDEYGHVTGDEILQAVAQAIASVTRAGDVLGRIGGEEFCLVLPATGDATARTVAERVRASVAALEAPASVTVSVGLGTLSSRGVVGRVALLQSADGALYEAKRQGRNRVCEVHAA
jgi:diguanylate cyclase (GGDEF)-like protein